MPKGEADIEKKKAIKKLIDEAITFDLDEVEIMTYIDQRLPIKQRRGAEHKIGRSTLYAYKKEIAAEKGDVDKRMFNHAKIGFVKKHFEIMDKTETVLTNLLGAFFLERNAQAKANYGALILGYLSYLHQLNISSPIIDQMKQYVHDHLNTNPTSKDTDTNADDSIPDSRSACILPKGFIKPGYNAANDGGGVSTGSKPVDRVF